MNNMITRAAKAIGVTPESLQETNTPFTPEHVLASNKEEFNGLETRTEKGKRYNTINQPLEHAVENRDQVYLTNPMTNRWYDDKTGSVSLEPTKGAKRYQVPSTAIQESMFDKPNDTSSIMYTKGNKYYDFNVNEDEFKQFLKAPSKGRWVNDVWKKWNRKTI